MTTSTVPIPDIVRAQRDPLGSWAAPGIVGAWYEATGADPFEPTNQASPDPIP